MNLNILAWPTGRACTAIAAALFVASAAQAPARAQTKEAEAAAVKACELAICTVAVKKSAAGGDIKCDLGKTWKKEDIAESVAKKKLTWSLGDARCTVPLMVPSQGLVDGLTKPAHTLALPTHTAKCEIDGAKDGEKAGGVTVELAPKFEFKDGKAVKISVNVTKIEGAAVAKGAIWTAATAEEYLGLFNEQMTAALNKLLLESCPKNHPAN